MAHGQQVASIEAYLDELGKADAASHGKRTFDVPLDTPSKIRLLGNSVEEVVEIR